MQRVVDEIGCGRGGGGGWFGLGGQCDLEGGPYGVGALGEEGAGEVESGFGGGGWCGAILPGCFATLSMTLV